ncbi:REP-associated tyrosine transposase [Scytonema sp. PCC 10023]|uniref:REP-associated tyrosine transposase n=1 Tax=Scytonema sp. PCC 10023 TaxID=1680591 RepID=UPI0039C5C382
MLVQDNIAFPKQLRYTQIFQHHRRQISLQRSQKLPIVPCRRLLCRIPQQQYKITKMSDLIKTYVTKHRTSTLAIDASINDSRQKRQESNLWQRRFWEDWIRDQADFVQHCDYIHYNPVKHGLCSAPSKWAYSSFHRFVAQGIYAADWGEMQAPEIAINIEDG